jgi:hypothetical protein
MATMLGEKLDSISQAAAALAPELPLIRWIRGNSFFWPVFD